MKTRMTLLLGFVLVLCLFSLYAVEHGKRQVAEAQLEAEKSKTVWCTTDRHWVEGRIYYPKIEGTECVMYHHPFYSSGTDLVFCKYADIEGVR